MSVTTPRLTTPPPIPSPELHDARHRIADGLREIAILRLEVELWKKRAKANGDLAKTRGQQIADLQEELDENN